jgi:hypothetical protein
MHNIHYIVVRAESAKDAANEALSQIEDWGDENNWRSAGGVASENNNDNIECEDENARWGLDRITTTDNTPYQAILDSIKEMYSCYRLQTKTEKGEYKEVTVNTYHEALDIVTEQLQLCKSESSGVNLYPIQNMLNEIEAVHDSQRLGSTQDIVEFKPYMYDNVGLTDFSQYEDDESTDDGTQRYIVLIDMHS